MSHRLRVLTAGVFTLGTIGLSACGGGHDTRTTSNGDVNTTPATATTTRVDTAPATHHSKLGGALVGAAVGHVLGGHAVAGAAAGALVQHERNKH